MAKRKRKKTAKAPPRDAPWTPFYQCTNLRDGTGKSLPVPKGVVYLRNNHYQVDLHPMKAQEPWGRVVWLSIKRNDRAPIHDWRDLQRIKNEVCGPDLEAVELYPAEDRHVDTSNQYHLWVFLDGWRFPYGYQERLLMDPDFNQEIPEGSLSRQRPFRGHMRPNDVMGVREAYEAFDADQAFGTRLTGTKKES